MSEPLNHQAGRDQSNITPTGERRDKFTGRSTLIGAHLTECLGEPDRDCWYMTVGSSFGSDFEQFRCAKYISEG
jgi:hypothetical protein